MEGGDGEPKTLVLLRHGVRLPASKQHILKTTRALTPGQAAGINIHVVEGEAARADRNDHVGYVRLDGRDTHRPLPVGSEVDVTLSVDTSRRLKVQAFVPMLDRTFDLAIEDVNRPTPNLDVLERQLKYEEEERLAKLSRLGETRDVSAAVADVRRALDEARSGDQDAALRAQRRLRELQSDLDAVESAAGIDLLDARWRDAVSKARAALGDFGSPNDRQRLLILEREGNEALAGRQRAQLQERVTQVEQLCWNTLMAQPGWWIGLYQQLVEMQDAMPDTATARLLIPQGRRALERQDFEELQQVCRRLWDLLSESARGDAAHSLPDVAVRG